MKFRVYFMVLTYCFEKSKEDTLSYTISFSMKKNNLLSLQLIFGHIFWELIAVNDYQIWPGYTLVHH